MHLRGLLEAEVVEPYALGVLKQVDDQQLEAVVEHAISAFLRAYAI